MDLMLGSGYSMYQGGCGPTTTAIALSGYGKLDSPWDVALKMTSGTGSSTIKTVLSTYGVSSTVRILSEVGKSTAVNEIKNNLLAGRPVCVGVGSSSGSTGYRYTTGAHRIVLLSYNSDTEEVFVGDSWKTSRWHNLSDLVEYYIISYVLITN